MERIAKSQWIRQAITRAIAIQDRPIRLPVHVYEDLSKIRKVCKNLLVEGKPVNTATIAEASGLSEHKVERALAAPAAKISLNKPVGKDEEDELGNMLGFDLPGSNPEEVVQQSFVNEQVMSLLAHLSQNERDVIMLRYGFDIGQERTLDQVGKMRGISRERVRQILVKAMQKLGNLTHSQSFSDYEID